MAHEDATPRRHVLRRATTASATRSRPSSRARASDWQRQAARGRRRPRRDRRRRHPRRRRDGRRDVVAIRRPGRAQRGRPALRRQHPSAHPARASGTIRSTSPPTPIPRATAPSARRTRIPTCCCTSCGRPTAASSCAAPSTRPPRPTPNQAFAKPTIANWGDAELSDYAVGFIVDMGAPGLKHICRTGFAGPRAGRGLPARQPLRRGRHAARLRRRRDPLGGRPLLPPHARGELHPRHAAPLQRVRRSCSARAPAPT